MALRFKKPEAVEKRLKMMVYGPAGVGKTTSVIQFPDSCIFDGERGTENYPKAISKSGSQVLHTVDCTEITDQMRELLTTQHDFRTMIIDPMTAVYGAMQDKWNGIFERNAKADGKKSQAEIDTADWGQRYWGKVKGEYKAMLRLILRLDMNVIVTAHQKDLYGEGMKKLGVTFDSMKGDDYFYDFIFRLEKGAVKPDGSKTTIAYTMKQREEPGEPNKFPEMFEWSYANFCKFYGADVIKRKAKAIKLATPEQAAEFKKLLDTVKTEDGWLQKILDKADVENIEDLAETQIVPCIEMLKKKLA